ncbi:MAG: hypothetical protein LM556_00670 [Desulfurococcaceae archaeon]|jgi:hypothetical protein|nr:hypothetical protein [Desulfurococcaceae archaeon]
MSTRSVKIDSQFLRNVLLDVHRVCWSRENIDKLRRDLREILSGVGGEELINDILKANCK